MMGAVYMAAPVAWGGSGRQRVAMWVNGARKLLRLSWTRSGDCGGVKGWCSYFCQLDPVTPQKGMQENAGNRVILNYRAGTVTSGWNFRRLMEGKSPFLQEWGRSFSLPTDWSVGHSVVCHRVQKQKPAGPPCHHAKESNGLSPRKH